MLNIAGLTPVDDPSYRYQMPRITAKIEGRGNGIKTVLTNVSDVALSLNRDAAEVTKFFGCELGAQTTFSLDPVRAIVNGAHNAPDLQNFLSRYIENFVLCKQCRLPETIYKIKGGLIQQKCLACGAKEPCDMAHKLTGFILNQHKKAKAEKSDEKEDKKQKKEERRLRREEAETNGETAAVAVGSDALPPPPSPEKEKKSKKDKSDKEKKSKKDKKKKEDGAEVTGDAQAEAVGDASSEDEETDFKAAAQAIEKLEHWKVESGASASSEAILDKLKTIHTLSGLRPADRVIIFLGAFFNENAVRENQVQKNKAVLRALTPSPIHQRHLISATEWFCGTRYPALLSYFPVILKHLYDEDLLEEDTILAWSADASRNEYTSDATLVTDLSLDQLRISAQPFCKWLEEAGVEGEEDDDDDEDEEDGDDVDIDAI